MVNYAMNLRASLYGSHFARDATNVRRDVEFALASGVVHVANFTKHGALFPTLVMNTGYGPHAPDITIWIESIECVRVVQRDRRRQRRLGRRCPFENFFRPIHSHESVHAPEI